jgi:tetratricopeptide (TPR) repeat protein
MTTTIPSRTCRVAMMTLVAAVSGYLVAVVCAAPPPPSAVDVTPADPSAWQQPDRAADDTLAQAEIALKRRQYEEALKLYKRANATAGDRSPDALWGMAQAYSGLGAAKNVSETVDRLLPLVKDDPKRQAEAHNLAGLALFNLGQANSDAKKFAESEPHFAQAIDLWPELAVSHYNLALALFKRKADPAGIEQMQTYLQMAPAGPYAAAATQYIENPRRARENYATEFSGTSSEGERISLAELKGKVVLLDFWATWCGPCKDALPSLKRLLKQSSEDSLVGISISTDREAETWRAFIADNQMTWPQLHDARGVLSRTYGVDGIPTYVVIDHEGIVRKRLVGYSVSIDGELQDAVRKCVKAARAAAVK